MPARTDYTSLLAAVGLTVDTAWTDPRVKVWRSLPDRENAVLDFELDGRKHRWHVKRYPPANRILDAELRGAKLLADAGIPVAPVVLHGRSTDGRSVLVLDDLAGYQPGDKFVNGGGVFDTILESTAAVAAKLHSARLHHRDLYLCHFMVKPGSSVVLIDTARVAPMRNPLTRRRWVVKDIGQFVYSLAGVGVDAEKWLTRYEQLTGRSVATAAHRKAAAIARHDRRLQIAQPARNVSVPESDNRPG